MHPILKGLFSKWFCPECRKILKRSQVKYQEEFNGYGTFYWFRCLHCGNADGVQTVQERLEELITQ